MIVRRLAGPVLLLSSLAFAACTGDDEGGTPDAGGVTIDAMPGIDGGAPDECICFVVGSDPANGVGTGATIGLPSLAVTRGLAAGGVSSDPVVRALDGKIYVVNRLGANNVTIIDPAAGFTVAEQFSTGADTNPQDIAIAGPNKLYVAILGSPAVQVWDTTDLTAPVDMIALPTTKADADGNSDAASIVVLGDKAYVTLEHLESFVPVADGEVVIIDTDTDTVDDVITLSDRNPIGFMRAAGQKLLVALTPDFGDTSAACLEQVTPGAEATSSCLATGTSLGGLVTGIAPRDGASGEIFVAVGDFVNGSLLRLSSAGAKIGTSLSASGQVPVDVAACGNFVVGSDSSAGGIRVWNATSGAELTTSALDIGLPPAFSGAIACLPVAGP